MRVQLLALAILALATSPAAALTCDEFLDRTQKSDTADLLPDFRIRPQQGMPDGYFEITNLRNIETGMECLGGEFGGFGASLLEGAEPDRMRFAALIRAMLKAVAPEVSDSLKIAADTQSRAIDAARRNEIKLGIFTGSAESEVGAFDLSISAGTGSMSFDISPK